MLNGFDLAKGSRQSTIKPLNMLITSKYYLQDRSSRTKFLSKNLTFLSPNMLLYPITKPRFQFRYNAVYLYTYKI